MTESDAQIVYEHLSIRGSVPASADLAIGFGHFDLRIATTCARLWEDGRVRRMVFTGGVGAGSGDFDVPEAEAFERHARELCPGIPPSSILVESQSTNTGENVVFVRKLMQDAKWAPESVILVATPYRQRRVGLTWSLRARDDIPVHHLPPVSSLTTDVELFQRHGQDLTAALPGEVDRLVAYAERGWIARETVPSAVIAAADRLRRAAPGR
jgi:hypothetical protein